jgi:hypothetical protein
MPNIWRDFVRTRETSEERDGIGKRHTLAHGSRFVKAPVCWAAPKLDHRNGRSRLVEEVVEVYLKHVPIRLNIYPP